MSYPIYDANGETRTRNGKDVIGSSLPDELAVKRLVDPEKRTVEVVSSSDRQDRDGDRINQKGINHVGRVVLYAHDYGQKFLPIGKILGHRIERRKAPDGSEYDVTKETHQFNPPGCYEVSDSAWKLVEFGSLAGISISFIADRIIRATSDAERQQLGLGPRGVYFDTIEKLETSWCPVQSNRDAIREAFGKGVISRTEAQMLFPTTWHEVNAPKHWVVGCDFLRDPALAAKEVEKVNTEALATLGKALEQLQTGLRNIQDLLAEKEFMEGK